jgi:hypothetical protein
MLRHAGHPTKPGGQRRISRRAHHMSSDRGWWARFARNDGKCRRSANADTRSRSRGAMRPRFERNRTPLRTEGVGNAGCPVHPQPRTRILVVSMRTSIHSEVTGIIRHSRTRMVYGLYVISPVIGFLATVAREKFSSRELDTSTEVSGPHDFAVRFSAVRQRHLRVHRIPSRVRDDRDTPLAGTRRDRYRPDLGIRKTRIFLQTGLDRKIGSVPVGQIRLNRLRKFAFWNSRTELTNGQTGLKNGTGDACRSAIPRPTADDVLRSMQTISA